MIQYTLNIIKARYERDLCFDPFRPIRHLWLIVGIILILWGVSQILELYNIRFNIWSWVLIIIGLYIIYRALKSSRR
jgi:uncharacterized membrane protein